MYYYSDGKLYCEWCKEKFYDMLTIDHINNDGNKRRKIEGRGSALYKWLIRNSFPEGFQVLCFNCNWIKAHGYTKETYLQIREWY